MTPRVQIEYEVGDDHSELVELPFVIGVLADLSRNSTKELPLVVERKFVEVDRDNFENFLKSNRPRVAYEVESVFADGGRFSVDLTFASLDDFSPKHVAGTVEPLRSRLERNDVDSHFMRQLNLIIHHPDFLRLEAAWRGLHYLVFNTETSEVLKIKVFNISKMELGKTLEKYPDAAFDQSPLFKKIYENDFCTPGGRPFGLLVGDYYFDHSPADVNLLKGMARIAEAALAPFVSGAAPSLFNLQSWREVNNLRDPLKAVEGPDYLGWQGLRESDASRFLCLTLPGFLSRAPHRSEAQTSDFQFAEEIELDTLNCLPFANSAYIFGFVIARAFHRYGWCACIHGSEAGGRVEGCQFSLRTPEGEVTVGATEVAVSERNMIGTAKSGLQILWEFRNSPDAVFLGAISLHKPKTYNQAEANVAARLGARLNYLLPCCRFMHYLKCLARDNFFIRKLPDPNDLAKYLNDWLSNYVIRELEADSVAHAELLKSKRPLAAAEVRVEATDGDPLKYKLALSIKPHYQLECVQANLRLSTTLPL